MITFFRFFLQFQRLGSLSANSIPKTSYFNKGVLGMQGVFGNLINTIKEIWNNIGVAQKVTIILMIIATFIMICVVIYAGTRPQWDILFSGLDKKTAAGITDIIRDEGINYKLEDSGRTILVEGKLVNKLRLRIAQEGIEVEPNSRIKGWEQFDSAPLGLTEKQQKVMEIRAQQGELEKMINELPAVVSSKVMISFPEKRIFRKDQSRPAASVMVILKPGYSLEPRSITAIKYLVSTSIASMKPNDVTITDNQGNLLVKKNEEGNAYGGDTNDQLQIQRRLEEQLKEKAEAILRPIVGDKNVIAMVSLEMDFDEHSTERINYDPKKKVVLHEKVRSEYSTKNNGEAGGKTGTETNLTVSVKNPDGETNSDNKKMMEEKRDEADRTYATDKIVTKTKSHGAKIVKLNVAVTVAEHPNTADGKPQKWPLQDFTRLVSLAVGAEKYGENGKVEVKELSFYSPVVEVKELTPVEKVFTNIDKFSKNPLVRPMIAVVLLGLLFRMFRKYFGAPDMEDEVESEELIEENLNEQLSNAEQLEENVQSDEEIQEELDEISKMILDVKEKASASPEVVANIMEGWLTSE